MIKGSALTHSALRFERTGLIVPRPDGRADDEVGAILPWMAFPICAPMVGGLLPRPIRIGLLRTTKCVSPCDNVALYASPKRVNARRTRREMVQMRAAGKIFFFVTRGWFARVTRRVEARNIARVGHRA